LEREQVLASELEPAKARMEMLSDDLRTRSEMLQELLQRVVELPASSHRGQRTLQREMRIGSVQWFSGSSGDARNTSPPQHGMSFSATGGVIGNQYALIRIVGISTRDLEITVKRPF
jgi:hypothetical protein